MRPSIPLYEVNRFGVDSTVRQKNQHINSNEKDHIRRFNHIHKSWILCYDRLLTPSIEGNQTAR